MWGVLPLQPSPLPRHSMVLQEMGGLGRVVVAVLKSNDPLKVKPEEEEELSGSDVLMALQRASKKKKKQTKIRKSSIGVAAATQNNSKPLPLPLCIKPEWTDRLQQLETRLLDLSLA
ncbi:hypothetical protein ACS0TY_019124 [Phlomoides rotata]